MEKREIALKSQEGLIEVAHQFVSTKGAEITLPPNYDVNNAVKSFWLKLVQTQDKQGKSALEVCTPVSIQQAVQNMITKGVDPSKNQCYLIVRGKTLNLEVGSFGNVKQARSTCKIRINSVVIRQGDQVEIEIRPNGTKVIHHKTSWANADKELTGAYAVGVNMATGEIDNSDIMTAKEIKTSHLKSSNYGKVHNEFAHEMYRKTVASRLAKHYINTSDDSFKFEVYDENGKEITAENNYDYLNEQSISANDKFEEDTVIIVDDEPATETEPETLNDLPDIEEPDAMVCSKCGKSVTEKVYNFSKDRFGKPLCYDCQQEA